MKHKVTHELTANSKDTGVEVKIILSHPKATRVNEFKHLYDAADGLIREVEDGNQTDMFKKSAKPDPKETKAEIIQVDRARLEANGDIGKTVCGTNIDKTGKIKKPFTYADEPYVALSFITEGGATGPIQILAHEVVDVDKFKGETCTIDERKKDKKRPHYTGVNVLYGKKKYVLGDPVTFLCPAMNAPEKDSQEPGAHIN